MHWKSRRGSFAKVLTFGRPVEWRNLGRDFHRGESWERRRWELWSVEPRVLVRILCAELESGAEGATYDKG